ncbi:MAG: sugar kinase [Rhizobiaceae bacterium]|nr:sugar kinase [Rhizobiaceae bacterium]
MGNAIAAIGECMLELSADGQGAWRLGHAGDTFNTLWTMRALLTDRDADYVSAFGDDPFSEQQIAFLRENGIGTAASPKIAGARPGLYAITLDGAERSFTYWRADSAARQLASDPAALEKSLSDRALAYFSGITLAILDDASRETLFDALRSARSRGTLVAFDPNHRPRLWQSANAAQDVIGQALALSDIALPTFPDEQQLFGDASPEQTVERLARAGVGEAVVKNGEDAACLFTDGNIKSVPAIRVSDAVDTTGAGDSFNGAYLAARLLGHEPGEAAARAHRTAAAVIRVRGALAPFESLREAFAI